MENQADPSRIVDIEFSATAKPLSFYGYFGGDDAAAHSLGEIGSYTDSVILNLVSYDTDAVERTLALEMNVFLGLPIFSLTDDRERWIERLSLIRDRLAARGLTRRLTALLIYDEPDRNGVSTAELAEMIALAKQFFPGLPTMAVYNLFDAELDAAGNGGPTVPENLDWVAVDPYFYPDHPAPAGQFERCPDIDHHSKNGHGECFDAYVGPRLAWAGRTGLPIVLIGQAHGFLAKSNEFGAAQAREISVPQPRATDLLLYYRAALANPQIIGLFWFVAGNYCYPDNPDASDVIGARFDPLVQRAQREIGRHHLLGGDLHYLARSLSALDRGVEADHPDIIAFHVEPSVVHLTPSGPGTYSCGVQRLRLLAEMAVGSRLPVNGKLSWSVDEPDLAVIDEDGVLTARQPGETKIRLHMQDQTLSIDCIIDASECSAGLSIANDSLAQSARMTLLQGEAMPLRFFHVDPFGNEAEVTPLIESCDGQPLPVDSLGKITALKPGLYCAVATYHIAKTWFEIEVNEELPGW